MTYSFTIKGKLPSLNQYINAERTNRYIAAKLKKEATLLIQWQIDIPRITEPFILRCKHFTQNKRTDPDNLVFKKKFILDALLSHGKIDNDGWGQVLGFEESWEVDKNNPRIEVSLITKPQH